MYMYMYIIIYIIFMYNTCNYIVTLPYFTLDTEN